MKMVLSDDISETLLSQRFLRTGLSQIPFLFAAIESKKAEEDGKYVPISLRMQKAQVSLIITHQSGAVPQEC